MKTILPVWTQEKDPKINPEKPRHNCYNSKLLKQNSISAKHYQLRQNKMFTEKKPFRTLNHPYTMKIALNEEISEETAPFKITNHLQQKKPIKSNTPELIPFFAAR